MGRKKMSRDWGTVALINRGGKGKHANKKKHPNRSSQKIQFKKSLMGDRCREASLFLGR